MGARILVVDDSPTIRKVVASILTSKSYDAVTAEDGQDALIKIKSGVEFDLILLDFVMPRMNGYQFCRELRAHPERANVPVVLMSAKGDKIRGQFVQQTGAIDAITKPFDARGLIAVVEGALKKHQEGRGPVVPEAGAMPDESTIAEEAMVPEPGRAQRRSGAAARADGVAVFGCAGQAGHARARDAVGHRAGLGEEPGRGRGPGHHSGKHGLADQPAAHPRLR